MSVCFSALTSDATESSDEKGVSVCCRVHSTQHGITNQKNFDALRASQSAREHVRDSHLRVAGEDSRSCGIFAAIRNQARDESGWRVAEQASESLQLVCTEVRNRPISHAVCCPREHVIAPRALRLVDGDGRIRDGSKADDVLAAAIDQ